MAYCIEPADSRHIPGICQAHREAVLGIGPGTYPAAELDAWAAGMRPEKVDRALTEAGMTILVALAGKTVAGFIFFTPGEIKALYVRPTHGHQGVGGRLLELAETTCRHAETPVLRLTASRNAVPFYTAKGFQTVGRGAFPLAGGITLRCIIMEKRFDCKSRPPQQD